MTPSRKRKRGALRFHDSRGLSRIARAEKSAHRQWRRPLQRLFLAMVNASLKSIGYIPMILKDAVLLNQYSFRAGTSSSDAETSRKVRPTVEHLKQHEVYLLRTEASALQRLPQWSSLVGKQRPPLQPKPLPFDLSLHVNTTYNYKSQNAKKNNNNNTTALHNNK